MAGTLRLNNTSNTGQTQLSSIATTDRTINLPDADGTLLISTLTTQTPLPDGTEAEPGITFANDLDTGIYRPGTNEIGLVTGATERLRIDDSGNVGIGTTSPDALMHLSSATGSATPTPTELRIASTTDASDWSTTDPWGRISFYSSDTSAGGPKIHAAITTTAVNANNPCSNINFAVNAGSFDNLFNVLTITGSSGNVGIRTTNPAALLHVTNTSAQTYSGTAGIQTHLFVDTSNSNGDNQCSTMYFRASGNGTTNNARGFINLIQPTATSNGSEFAFQLRNTDGNIVETMRMDRAGRILVGTDTARTNFSLTSGTAQHDGLVQFEVPSTEPLGLSICRNGASPYLLLAATGGDTIGSTDPLVENDGVGIICFSGTNGNGGFSTAAQIAVAVDAPVTGTGSEMPGRLTFWTTPDGQRAPVERMRIINSGSIFFNTESTPTSSNSGFLFTNSGRLIHYSSNAASSTRVFEAGGSNGYARIMGDGDLENTNNRYTGISDVKLKQNIEDATSQWDDIKNIQVRKYEFIANPDRKHIGVVAQELEKVCPGLVIERDLNEETGETVKSVAYSVLYMKAVKALQEAMTRIETLEAKVAALEGV